MQTFICVAESYFLPDNSPGIPPTPPLAQLSAPFKLKTIRGVASTVPAALLGVPAVLVKDRNRTVFPPQQPQAMPGKTSGHTSLNYLSEVTMQTQTK